MKTLRELKLPDLPDSMPIHRATFELLEILYDSQEKLFESYKRYRETLTDISKIGKQLMLFESKNSTDNKLLQINASDLENSILYLEDDTQKFGHLLNDILSALTASSEILKHHAYSNEKKDV